MDSIKALADTNIKISEAKNVLFKLQETETEYLVAREEKAIQRIQKGVEDSRNLLEEVKNNHNAVQEFYRTVCGVSDFLEKAQTDFFSLLENFNRKSELWEKEYQKQCDEVAQVKRNNEVEKVKIHNDTISNQKTLKKITEEKSKIESRQAQIKSALEVLNKKQNGK